jgi:hypothetical protein
VIADCQYFTVRRETKDYVVLGLNLDEPFEGVSLRDGGIRLAAQFAQYLLDEHGLEHVDASGSGSLLCRKVKESA